METDEILKKAADEAEQHEIVGRCYREFEKANMHMHSAELLIRHIMQSNQQKDLGKEI